MNYALKRAETVIVAHRGASAYAPENTMSAFERAVRMGADMVELDVRRTQDGVLVVYHNSKLSRRRLLKRLDYHQIQSYNPAIPTLEVVLAKFHNQIQFDIELKESGYELEVVNLLLNYLPPNAFVITSFLENTVRTVKQHYPQLQVGLLIGASRTAIAYPSHRPTPAPIAKALSLQADFLAPHWQRLTPKFLAAAQMHQLPLWVWTVNNRILMRQLLRIPQVKAVITDRPDRGLQLRQKITTQTEMRLAQH